jgi:predicted nucleic acid-binding protein
MQETIICNTGPIIALAGIQKLDVLKHIFGTVIIPEPVRIEILTGGKTLIGLDEFLKAGWLTVKELNQQPDPLLSNLLDQGEASVIHIAREMGIDRILMDERKGRRVAREIYGLKVTGTIRVLVEAKKAGLIENLEASIQEIRNSGYWIHDKIIQRALKESGADK